MTEDLLVAVGVSAACGIASLAGYLFVVDCGALVYPQRLRSLAGKKRVLGLRRKGGGGTAPAFTGPLVQLARRVSPVFREASMRRQVERSFPEVVDLMLVCVDAGMNLPSALKYVAHVTGGPLGDDLKRSVYAASTGRGMREALKELCGPHSTPALRFFVTTIGFSYLRGNPVSEVLRAQAWMARQQRKQALEAAVRSMPTKIMVCSILFFMPPILVVTVLPGVLVFLVSRW
ncbi:MAG: type II secretion system F family protein [Ignavibacteriales bacterium]